MTLGWLRDALAEGPRAQLPPSGQPGFRALDTRERSLFEANHIPGTCSLSAAEIDVAFLRPPRRRPIVVLDADAGSAVRATSRLLDLGYRAWVVDEPLASWRGPWEIGPEKAPSWEPSRLAARWAPRLSGRAVLDLACGSGRDAVFFALNGADVTGIDVLADALEQAARIAERHHVAVRLVESDLERGSDAWDDRWDAIHVHRFLHRAHLPLLRERLAPGGWLLVSTFLEEQARTGRKPSRWAHLLRPGELLDAARGLEIVEYTEGLTETGDWLASLVARRSM